MLLMLVSKSPTSINSSLDSLSRTISFAKSIHLGANYLMCYVNTSKTIVKRYEFRVEPWCNHILIGKSSESPPIIRTLNKRSSYISWIIQI